MTERDSDIRKEMRAFIEENFLYLHPDVELRRRRRLPGARDHRLARLRRAGRGGPVALRDRDRRRRDHRGELRLDRRDRRLRRAQARGGVSIRTIAEDLRCGRRAATRAGWRSIARRPRGHLRRARPARRRLRRRPGASSASGAATGSRCCCRTASTRRSRSRARCAPGAAIAPLNPTIKRDRLDYVLADIEPRGDRLRRRARRARSARRPRARAGSRSSRRSTSSRPTRRLRRRRPLETDLAARHVHVGLDRRAEGGHADATGTWPSSPARSSSTWR